MRKLSILAFTLWAAFAVAQQPQWQVVASVNLFDQNQTIPQTTLLTPSAPGTYRLTFYFSGGGGSAPGGYFDAVVTGQDIGGVAYSDNIVATCGMSRMTSFSPIIDLKPNQPLTYEVNQGGLASSGCNYNLTITVEELM